MNVTREIRVLNAFRPYFRLMTAYNSEHFRSTHLRHIRRSIFYAIFSTTMIVTLIILSVFIAWYLGENEAKLKRFVVSLPMIFTLMQMVLTFIGMMLTNHTTSETINQIQRVVDQRESLYSVHVHSICC